MQPCRPNLCRALAISSRSSAGKAASQREGTSLPAAWEGSAFPSLVVQGGMWGVPEGSPAGIGEPKCLCHGSPLPPCLWGLQKRAQHPLLPLFYAPGTTSLHNLHHAMPLPPPSPYLKAARKQSILTASPDGEDRENTRCNQTQLGPSAAVYPRQSCPTRTPGNCIFIQEEPLEGSYKHFVMYRATS